MTDVVRYYRCPTCGAVEWAADLGTPWAGVGWTASWDDLLGDLVAHWCGPQRGRGSAELAEPLSELPREAVLS